MRFRAGKAAGMRLQSPRQTPCALHRGSNRCTKDGLRAQLRKLHAAAKAMVLPKQGLTGRARAAELASFTQAAEWDMFFWNR